MAQALCFVAMRASTCLWAPTGLGRGSVLRAWPPPDLVGGRANRGLAPDRVSRGQAPVLYEEVMRGKREVSKPCSRWLSPDPVGGRPRWPGRVATGQGMTRLSVSGGKG